MPAKIAIDHQAIAALCRRHGIRKRSLFGSVLHAAELRYILNESNA